MLRGGLDLLAGVSSFAKGGCMYHLASRPLPCSYDGKVVRDVVELRYVLGAPSEHWYENW